MQMLHHSRECANGGSDSDALVSSDESMVMFGALITHIRVTVTHVSTVKLRRIPIGFYISVKSEIGIQRTLNKPAVVGMDIVEWNDEILLPSEHSSEVSLSVLASFEFGSTLGGGEILYEIRPTVGELLDRSRESEIIMLSGKENGNIAIKIRRVTGLSKYVTVPNPIVSEETRKIEELTNMGYSALVRYRELLKQQELEDSIRYFEQARDLCPPDHTSRGTVLFSLANAKMMDCRMNDVSPDLDTPIELYRTALSLRSHDHPNYPLTLLSLGLSLKARFQRQGDEADRANGDQLLSQVLDLCQSDSYVYQAAFFAINNVAHSELLPLRETLHATEHNANDKEEPEEEEKIDRLDTTLQSMFYSDSSRPPLLDPLGVLFCIRLDWVGSIIDRDRAISVLELVAQYTSDGHPEKPVWLVDLARLLWNRYEHSKDEVDLQKLISFTEGAVRLTPDDHPQKPTRLGNLAVSISCRYDRFGNLTDLEKSISLKEDTVRLTPDEHPDKHTRLCNLAGGLLNRYVRFGNVVDLEYSISLKEDALRLTPNGHPHKPVILGSLAQSLSSRYQRFGNIMDLEKSISLKEDALRLIPDDHPDRPTRLGNLARSFWNRYEHFGDTTDLEKSICLDEDAVQLTPDDHPGKPQKLQNLAFTLWSRYTRSGDVVDLEKSLSLREEALELTPDGHPHKITRLADLAHSLSGRYERFGNTTDLEKSISLREEAVRVTPDGHPDKLARLSNLAYSLSSRYDRFGDAMDLEKSISLNEDAVRLTPDGHSGKLAMVTNLAYALSARYQRFGDIMDLEKAVSLEESGVQLTPDEHPEKAWRLQNLASALSGRYDRFGDIEDLEKSISLGEDALRLAPDDHPDKHIVLRNLARSLLSRRERFGDKMDLEKSMSFSETALGLTPEGHPDKPSRLADLAFSVFSRYKHFGDIADLERSILLKEDALQLTPDGHPDKPRRLYDLASSLSKRYEDLGDIMDLERSLSLDEDAVRLTPDGDPEKPVWMKTTALLLLQRFGHFGESLIPDLHRAISYSSCAAHSYIDQPSVRFQSSQIWIKCLRLLPQDTQSLFDAFTITLELLPQLAWLGLSFRDRYHRLTLLEAAGVVPDAAAVALDVHKPELAIEWLEQGRSVVWGQVSQLRTPLDDLRSAHPVFATRFEHISRELELAGVRRKYEICGSTTGNCSTVTAGFVERQSNQHHTLASLRRSLLADIRALPGFEHFLLPKTIDQLSALVHSGYVVFLNTSKQRCDALVALGSSKKVLHVPLSHISYAGVANMRRQLNGLLRYHGRIIRSDEIDREGGARPIHLAPNDVFESILSRLWDEVVHPILLVLGLSTPPVELPRVFWCPTGPFTFLPIHAAGIYGATKPGPKLSDFVISSYIPTMSALPELPQQESQMALNKVRLLAVPQPSTDGDLSLNGVKEEMEFIRELASSSPFMEFEEADGTVEDVLAKMRESDWVHFCCHGTQDRTNPLDSGLLLAHRMRLKLSDVVQLSRPRRGLAFLSACQTATGDVKLSDEAIHLAAGMLLAGYSGIIGTMWSIMDRDAPRVTKNVYTSLFGDGRVPDSRRAAEALHHAVKKLRDSGAPFLSWVPFVHYGL